MSNNIATDHCYGFIGPVLKPPLVFLQRQKETLFNHNKLKTIYTQVLALSVFDTLEEIDEALGGRNLTDRLCTLCYISVSTQRAISWLFESTGRAYKWILFWPSELFMRRSIVYVNGW